MLRRTLGAQVENLQFVGDGLVLQLLGGFVDPLLKSGNLDFDGPPAFVAYDVMVVMLVRALAVEASPLTWLTSSSPWEALICPLR